MQTKFLNRERLIKICKRLYAKGISQREIARKLKIHYNTVYKYIHLSTWHVMQTYDIFN